MYLKRSVSFSLNQPATYLTEIVPQRASLKARKAAPILPPPDEIPPALESFPQTQSVRTESQTQYDLESFSQGVKRPAESHPGEPRPRKKVKISIASGVDLAE